MSRVKLVTGFVPIEGHPRTAADYGALGAELANTTVPLQAFHAQLRDCWLYGMLAELPYAVTHSEGDNPRKNTLAYHIVNHQKTAWLLEASLEDRESDVFVWVDYGITHLPGVTTAVIEECARAIADDPPTTITVPGCWNESPVSDAFPCWRFCGSVLICPRHHLRDLDQAVRVHAFRCVQATRNVPWEVNTWARVEQSREVSIAWYRADHDQTLFTNYGATRRARREAGADAAG